MLQAAQKLKEALDAGLSDNSDSDSNNDSDSESYAGNNCSQPSDEEENDDNNNDCNDEEGSADHNNNNKAKSRLEIEREVQTEENSIPIFSFHSLESSHASPVPQEMLHIFANRDDLFWILHDKLLVTTFCGYLRAKSPAGVASISTVANALYTMVYSCQDDDLSNKASETLCLLFDKCSTKVDHTLTTLQRISFHIYMT